MIPKEYRKPLVIYHANCADGFTAAWCFHHYSPEGFDYHPGVYNEPPPYCRDRVVYLVDFSYKRAVVEGICKIATEVILIDHHKTAIDDLGFLIDQSCPDFQSNFTWYVDTERSGARLAWDYIYNRRGTTTAQETIPPIDPMYKQPPLLLGYVEDRDLWKFKLANSREVSASIFSYKYSFEQWDKLMAGGAGLVLGMAAEGSAIERKHHKDIEELLHVCISYGTIGGFTVPIANLPYTLASDACHRMAKEWKDGKMFAASYYDTANHRVFSLRSTPDGMDVSDIAKLYPGGGGHKHAAGFRIPLADIMKEKNDGK